jgi:hypothetical protein
MINNLQCAVLCKFLTAKAQKALLRAVVWRKAFAKASAMEKDDFS